MGNFQQYQHETELTAEERDRIRNHMEWERGRSQRGSEPTVTIGGRVTTATVGSGGKVGVSSSKGAITALAEPGLRPGHVVINGVETTVEAAKAAGLIPNEGFSGAHGGTDAAPRGQKTSGGNPVRKDATPSPEGAQIQDRSSKKGEDVKTSAANPQVLADKASETIAGIEQIYGSDVVDDGLAEAAETGYLPETDKLPQGVSGEHVNRIVEGYYAQANSALSKVGASVDTLMATMTDTELSEARRATIAGDSSKLQHLGRQALDRLATLPENDPEAFEELIADMKPDERKALGRGKDGSWTVTVGGQTMSFAMAVREGIARA